MHLWFVVGGWMRHVILVGVHFWVFAGRVFLFSLTAYQDQRYIFLHIT